MWVFKLCYNKNMKQRGFANILLIIIGVFIIIILFGYFRDKKIPAFKEVGSSNILATPYLGCGIQVYSPNQNSTIGNIFEFSGLVDGCGWNIQNGIIGTLEVLDSNNKSLTDKISVPANSDKTFKINVGLKRPYTDKNATIYFQSNDGSQIANFNIQLK